MEQDVMYVDEAGRPVNPPQQEMGGLQAPPMSFPTTDKADLLEKIKPDAIVETIRHRLMGEELIDGVWQKVEVLQNRALTKQGAWDIANLMLGVSSQNVAISKLNDKEIRDRALNIARTAQFMCLKNWKEYGIKGVDQFHFIHQIIFSNTFITLKQPEGAGIRKMLMGTISEHAVKSETEKKGGMFNLFRRR